MNKEQTEMQEASVRPLGGRSVVFLCWIRWDWHAGVSLTLMDMRHWVFQTAGLVRRCLPDAPFSSCCHLLSLVSWIINYISITCHSMYEASGGLSVGENGAGWTAVKRSRRGKTIFQAKSEHLDLSLNLLPGSTAGWYSGQLCDTVEFWCGFSALICVTAQMIWKCVKDFAATQAQ